MNHPDFDPQEGMRWRDQEQAKHGSNEPRLAQGAHNPVPFAVGANADETSIAAPLGMSEAAYQAAVGGHSRTGP